MSDDIDDILADIQDKASKNKISNSASDSKSTSDVPVESTNQSNDDIKDNVELLYASSKLVGSDPKYLQEAQQSFTNHISILLLQVYVQMKQDETCDTADVIMSQIIDDFNKQSKSNIMREHEINELKDSEMFNLSVGNMVSIERNQIKDLKIKAIDDFSNIAKARYRSNTKEDNDFTSG